MDEYMKLAIMQPYFLPYIGYFQLINSVDKFILYDNIKFTKKGWINRNRYLRNGSDAIFSLPLKKDSDYLDIKDRELYADFNKGKLLNQFSAAYRNAPHFDDTYSFFQHILLNNETNLFNYIYDSIVDVCNKLQIKTRIIVSSEIDIDHSLRSQDRVIAICHKLRATNYVNAIGGHELYKRNEFKINGIELNLLKTDPIEYKQFDNTFVPWLSIIDVMMFNSNAIIKEFLINKYTLI
jgi:hypothetical protein